MCAGLHSPLMTIEEHQKYAGLCFASESHYSADVGLEPREGVTLVRKEDWDIFSQALCTIFCPSYTHIDYRPIRMRSLMMILCGVLPPVSPADVALRGRSSLIKELIRVAHKP